METIMGVLSLGLALGAIWFTSEILKRVGRSHDPGLDRHVQGLNAVIAQNDRALRMLNQRLKEVESGIQGLKSGVSSSRSGSRAFEDYGEPAPASASAETSEAESEERQFKPSISEQGDRSAA